MQDTVFQDDTQRMQYEEYEYRKAQLQDMMTQFVQAYGRDATIELVGMVRKASHERVVVNNPMKAIRDAYEFNKGVSF